MNKVNYPENLKGRDFVCGDLHGSFQRLLDVLEFINFDKNVDRLFSVGDLVDRGPENEQCLLLLEEPWFHAVSGNHEQLMVDFYTNGPYKRYWVQNGGRWGVPYGAQTTNKIKALAEIADKLPLMITVKLQNNKSFHVIHAELGINEPITDLDLENPEFFEKVAFKQTFDGDAILWGRWLFGQLYNLEVTPELAIEALQNEKMCNPELSHIYSGHTPMLRPTRLRNLTNLDTGAYRSFLKEKDSLGIIPPSELFGLTVTEPLTDRFWLANYLGVKETSVVAYT